MSGGDTRLVALVFMAATCVMMAPLLGRAGWPTAADAAMVLAAVLGVAAFTLAARDTFLAARRPRSPHESGSDDPGSLDPEGRQQP